MVVTSAAPKNWVSAAAKMLPRQERDAIMEHITWSDTLANVSLGRCIG